MMNLKNKWMIIPIITGVLVLGSIALVAGANENMSKDNVANQQKDKLTNEEISEKALAVVDGTVTKVEMEQKSRGFIYEVEIHKDGIEYELDMDAFTGEVLKSEQSSDDDNDDSVSESDWSNAITDPKNFKVSMDEAIEIALKQANGTVEEVEIEKEHSKLYYKIEIVDGGKEVDVLVDTDSGNVSIEQDDDDNNEDD
ncbi:PepSY domain-containing protein [Paenisporosarcina indica]|uniref:PepSY domain-containing protein n=1 Tax=Paenisporosarcina indica TaxID=650093 RepID=UPI0009501D0F|nr:PepSY domain-containing protein [Paenisporosarcina indica]